MEKETPLARLKNNAKRKEKKRGRNGKTVRL